MPDNLPSIRAVYAAAFDDFRNHLYGGKYEQGCKRQSPPGEARMSKPSAAEVGKGKSPNQGLGGGATRTDNPLGGNSAGSSKIPEKLHTRAQPTAET